MGVSTGELKALYRQAPDKVKAGGSAWYWRARRACRKLERETGLPWHRIAAAVAVFSPLQTWGDNLRQAAALADAIGNGKPLPKPETFGRNYDKACRALEGEPLEDVVRGPKVTRFYRAICGDDTAAVVDSWMCKLLGWDKGSPRPGQTYGHLAAYIEDAARDLNISVAELQATLWILVRDHGQRLSDGSVVLQEDVFASELAA